MLKSRYYAWLIPYVEGTLDANRCHVLEKRLAVDPKLAAEAEALRRVTSHLRRSAQAEPPAVAPAHSVWPRVQVRLRQRGPAPLVSPRLAWGGAVAVVLGIVVAALPRPDLPDNYFPPVEMASVPHHSAEAPPASPPFGDETFGGPVSVLSAPHLAAPVISEKPAARSVADRLAPLPPRFAGHVITPNGAMSFGRYVSPSPALIHHGDGGMMASSNVPQESEPEISPAAPEASANALAKGEELHAPPAHAVSTVLTLPGARMARSGSTLPADIFHPAPAVSPDAIGVADVNRFFMHLPVSARVAHRSESTLMTTRALSAAESVAKLRAEAHGEQERGNLSSAIDTWRDALYVSLTSPTYADERATDQANETLAIVQQAGLLDDLRVRLERQEEFAPDDIVSLRALGSLYTLTGSIEQASSAWRQAAQSDQGSGEDWFQLAGAELINGDRASARIAYENAVRPDALPLFSIHRTVAQRWLTDHAN